MLVEIARWHDPEYDIAEDLFQFNEAYYALTNGKKALTDIAIRSDDFKAVINNRSILKAIPDQFNHQQGTPKMSETKIDGGGIQVRLYAVPWLTFTINDTVGLPRNEIKIGD